MQHTLLFRPVDVTQTTKPQNQVFPLPGKESPPGVGNGFAGVYEASCKEYKKAVYHYTRFNTFSRRVILDDNSTEASTSSSHKKCYVKKVFGLGNIEMFVTTQCGKKIELCISYTITLQEGAKGDYCPEEINGKVTKGSINGKPAKIILKEFVPLGGSLLERVTIETE